MRVIGPLCLRPFGRKHLTATCSPTVAAARFPGRGGWRAAPAAAGSARLRGPRSG